MKDRVPRSGRDMISAVHGRPSHRQAVLAVVAAAMLFGTTGTAQSLGPDNSTPWGVGTLRIMVGSFALWVLARSLPKLSDLRGSGGVTLMLGGLGVAIYQPAFFLGVDRLGVALGTMITLATGPVIAGLFDGVIQGRRPNRFWALGTGVMVAGVVALALSRSGLDTFALDVLGVVGSAGAGFGYALYAAMARRAITAGVESTRALAWEHTIGSFVLAPGLLVVPWGWASSVSGVTMLAHLGVLTVGVAYLLYGIGLRTLESSTAVSITLVEPLTATMLAVIVLNEDLGTIGWFGAAIVVGGLAVVGRNDRSE